MASFHFRFQFSIFLYLLTIVPPVWIIELTKFGRWTEAQNATLGVEDVSVKKRKTQ